MDTKEFNGEFFYQLIQDVSRLNGYVSVLEDNVKLLNDEVKFLTERVHDLENDNENRPRC